MKKCLIFVLCLALLGGCVSLPVYEPRPRGEELTTAVPAAIQPTAAAAPASANETPAPAGDAPATAAPTHTEKAPATPKRIGSPAATPKPTATPRPTAAPTPTVPPKQTYAGTYFQFTAPGAWLKATVKDGVYFFPDVNDTRHDFFLYQESPNDMGLTETKLDIGLAFSSRESIAAMVEGALAGCGLTDFRLPSLTVKKTKLNGLTCYKGVSDIVMEGKTRDFEGYIFLRSSKLVLLVWVGDKAKNETELQTIYDSLEALR